MKKSTCVLVGMVFAMSAATTLRADDTPYPIGHCYGEQAMTNTIKFDLPNADISAAIFIPASYAATVTGDELTAIRVAMNTKLKVQELTAWVREDLAGENLASKTIEGAKVAKGWNDLRLTTPYAITGKGFYIGYTFRQTSATKAILNLSRPGTGSLYLKGGKDEWADRSEEGILCVEGLVEGSVRPAVNAALVTTSMPKYFILTNQELTGAVEVRNLGTETITGVDLDIECGGAEKKTLHIDADIPYGTSAKLPVNTTLSINSADPEMHPVKFTLAAVSGKEDPDMSNNSATHTFVVRSQGFNRKVFIEEFTTEKCVNCPRIAGWLHNVLEKKGDKVDVVCHHAGYYEDWLTLPADKEYLWLFGPKGTFAPALMIDRVAFAEQEYPTVCPISEDEIADQIDLRLGEISTARLTVDCDRFDSDATELTVNVKCERADENSMTYDSRLNVFLVENDVPAQSQAGGDENYMHQHVKRALNSTWGEEIKWNGTSYDYSIRFRLDPAWDKTKMQVVAMIYNFDRYDCRNNAIENCASVDLKNGTLVSGIEGTFSGSAENVEAVYDLWGNRLESPAPGVNIIRMSDGSSRKVIIRR